MIAPNYFLLIVGLLAVGTFSIRGSFIFFSRRLRITPELRELFGFIPAAIFPALIIPQAYFHQGEVASLLGKERFLVLCLAGLLCYVYRSTLAVILLGLAALYLLRSFA